jgi:hypothetical protein
MKRALSESNLRISIHRIKINSTIPFQCLSAAGAVQAPDAAALGEEVG